MSDKQTSKRRDFPHQCRSWPQPVCTVAAGCQCGQQFQAGSSGFVPERHPEDSWMEELGGKHRAFVDSSHGPGGCRSSEFRSQHLTRSCHGIWWQR
jgi:hypothetical protein